MYVIIAVGRSMDPLSSAHVPFFFDADDGGDALAALLETSPFAVQSFDWERPERGELLSLLLSPGSVVGVASSSWSSLEDRPVSLPSPGATVTSAYATLLQVSEGDSVNLMQEHLFYPLACTKLPPFAACVPDF